MDHKYCEELPLAIASVPMQKYENIYPPEIALEKGTMFCDLYMSFEGKGSRQYAEQMQP